MKDTSKSIIVDREKIEYEIKNADIFTLKYYNENPRVASILSKYPNEEVTQELIERELWKLDSTKDLYQDIKRNNGLIEEIIVKGDEVLEGNSRLCSYRELYKKASTDKEREHWKYIKTKILPSNITQEQIFIILGTFHIKGKAKWRTYEQGSYLYKMVNVFGKKPDEVADMIGIPKADIKNMISSYEAMNKEKIPDLNKFSFFVEYYKNRDLNTLRGKDPTLDTKFAGWIKDDKIPRAEKVRDLPKILNDKKAKRSFIEDEEEFDCCVGIATQRNPEEFERFYRALKDATNLLRIAPLQKIKDEVEENTNKKDIIRRLAREINKFCKNLDINV